MLFLQKGNSKLVNEILAANDSILIFEPLMIKTQIFKIKSKTIHYDYSDTGVIACTFANHITKCDSNALRSQQGFLKAKIVFIQS